MTKFSWTGRSVVTSGTRYLTNCSPEGAMVIETVVNGRPTITQRRNSAGTQIGRINRAYDPHGRLETLTDDRNGTFTWQYYTTNDLVRALITPPSGTDGTRSGGYEYDPFGGVIRVDAVNPVTSWNEWQFSTKRKDPVAEVVLYEYRGYDVRTGRWLSRDPIGEIASRALYSFVDNDGGNYYDINGLEKGSARGGATDLCKLSKPLHTKYGFEDWHARWMAAHSGLSQSQQAWVRETMEKGCIGLTMVELGTRALDYSNCYETKRQAQRRQKEMARNCACTPNRPQIFSVHLWNNLGLDGKGPDVRVINERTGQLNMDNYDYWARGDGYCNFDFGFVMPDGRVLHANHCHYCQGNGPMEVYLNSRCLYSIAVPVKRDYNREVWCVQCDGGKYR